MFRWQCPLAETVRQYYLPGQYNNITCNYLLLPTKHDYINLKFLLNPQFYDIFKIKHQN